jgi:hypothetical protein
MSVAAVGLNPVDLIDGWYGHHISHCRVNLLYFVVTQRGGLFCGSIEALLKHRDACEQPTILALLGTALCELCSSSCPWATVTEQRP